VTLYEIIRDDPFDAWAEVPGDAHGDGVPHFLEFLYGTPHIRMCTATSIPLRPQSDPATWIATARPRR
jgi:hypothetical protein